MAIKKSYNKGYKFEKTVKAKLESDGWKVIRSAGSKKPDLVAAKNKKIIVIECKSTKQDVIYLEKKEIENLEETAREFGAECLIAVKKNKNKNWFIIDLNNIEKTKKYAKINLNI